MKIPTIESQVTARPPQREFQNERIDPIPVHLSTTDPTPERKVEAVQSPIGNTDHDPLVSKMELDPRFGILRQVLENLNGARVRLINPHFIGVRRLGSLPVAARPKGSHPPTPAKAPNTPLPAAGQKTAATDLVKVDTSAYVQTADGQTLHMTFSLQMQRETLNNLKADGGDAPQAVAPPPLMTDYPGPAEDFTQGVHGANMAGGGGDQGSLPVAIDAGGGAAQTEAITGRISVWTLGSHGEETLQSMTNIAIDAVYREQATNAFLPQIEGGGEPQPSPNVSVAFHGASGAVADSHRVNLAI